jgi:anti-sigma factor RsiW
VIIDHISLETLSDYVDDALAPAERGGVERHLVSCSACAARLVDLRTLLTATHALPSSMEPPADLWIDVRSAIASRAEARGVPRRPVWERWGLLAAAALVLVVGSSAVTAVLMRQSTSTARVPSTAAPVAAMAHLPLPAAMRAIEANYASTASELADALALQRPKLAPATVAKVEASLRVIDDAIAEARRALAEDPANRALLDIFSSNYQQKLELLRRAAELPAST